MSNHHNVIHSDNHDLYRDLLDGLMRTIFQRRDKTFVVKQLFLWLLLALQIKVVKVASFVGKIFVLRDSTTKTTKCLPTENSPLYGTPTHTYSTYTALEFVLLWGVVFQYLFVQLHEHLDKLPVNVTQLMAHFSEDLPQRGKATAGGPMYILNIHA